jgi:transposase-like protein
LKHHAIEKIVLSIYWLKRKQTRFTSMDDKILYLHAQAMTTQ